MTWRKEHSLTVLAVLLAILLTSRCCRGDIIPASRLTIWTPGTYTGVPGGIPNTRTNYDVTKAPYNCPTNGVSNCSSAIQSAIDAAPSNTAVYLPAGSYVISNTVVLKSWVSLRGASSSNTVIKPGGNAYILFGVSTGGYWDPSTYPVATGGAVRASTTLWFTNTTSFTVGREIQISQFSSTNQYDTPLIWAIAFNATTNNGYGYVRREKARCLTVSSNNITFWPPMISDWTNRTVRVVSDDYAAYIGAGVENLQIDMSNATAPNAIFFEEALFSWVSGVKVRFAVNYSVQFMDCLQCTVRDSYLDELNHGGSNGAGLLFSSSSFCLVENNVIFQSFPCMEINSSCGNVFGYNFCLNTNGAVAIDANHGPHSEFNLYEGNISCNFMSDGYFGSEGNDVLFRNWLTGQGTGYSNEVGWCAALKRMSRLDTIIANQLGDPAYPNPNDETPSMGQPFIGNSTWSGFAPPWANWMSNGLNPGIDYGELDTNVQATTLLIGNYDFHTLSISSTNQSISGVTLTNSYYLTSKPDWFGSLAWPAINPNTPTTNRSIIPAALTFYNQSAPTNTAGPVQGDDEFSLVPTITNGTLVVSFRNPWKNAGIQVSNNLSNWTTLPSASIPSNAFCQYQAPVNISKQWYVRAVKK